jgi:hypothetical protein
MGWLQSSRPGGTLAKAESALEGSAHWAVCHSVAPDGGFDIFMDLTRWQFFQCEIGNNRALQCFGMSFNVQVSRPMRHETLPVWLLLSQPAVKNHRSIWPGKCQSLTKFRSKTWSCSPLSRTACSGVSSEAMDRVQNCRTSRLCEQCSNQRQIMCWEGNGGYPRTALKTWSTLLSRRSAGSWTYVVTMYRLNSKRKKYISFHGWKKERCSISRCRGTRARSRQFEAQRSNLKPPVQRIDRMDTFEVRAAFDN